MTNRSSERTILVVEDQPEVLALLADALGIRGYRVLTASQPDDGLAIGDKHADEIDLVLMDVGMPGMNGPEMAQRLVVRHPADSLAPSGRPHAIETVVSRRACESGTCRLRHSSVRVVAETPRSTSALSEPSTSGAGSRGE